MTKLIVPAETIAAFERDGAVALKGCFADWVGVLRAGIARNMAEPSADVRDLSRARTEAGVSSATTATGTGFRNTGISSSIRRQPRSGGN